MANILKTGTIDIDKKNNSTELADVDCCEKCREVGSGRQTHRDDFQVAVDSNHKFGEQRHWRTETLENREQSVEKGHISAAQPSTASFHNHSVV